MHGRRQMGADRCMTADRWGPIDAWPPTDGRREMHGRRQMGADGCMAADRWPPMDAWPPTDGRRPERIEKKINFFELAVFASFFRDFPIRQIPSKPDFYETIIFDTDFSRRSRQYRFQRDLTGSRGSF